MKLQYDQKGSLGYIMLDNPPHNELVSPVFADLKELEAFLALPELKAVILTGVGRHFCAGANKEKLEALKEKSQGDMQRLMAQGKALLRTLWEATIPVMAVIRGSCLGAGLEIALACHFRYASPNAMFGFPEIEHGVMPGLGGTVSALRTTRHATAIELMLSGKMVRGEEAQSMGLVDACAKAKDLDAKAAAFIGSLTERRSAHLVRTIMTSIKNADGLSAEEALNRETQLFCSLVEQQKKKDTK